MIMDHEGILESGMLSERREGCPECLRPFEICLLQPQHLEEVWALQELVVETLSAPAPYHPDPKDLLAQCLGPRGQAVGTFVDGRLVGFRSVFYPGDRPDNLGLDIQLTGPDLDRVAHLERAAVNPAYRGNRLQIRMTAHAIRLAVGNHRWRHLFSTVAPGNPASMKDKFTVGMVIVRTLRKYSGYWRHLFYQDILEPVALDLATTVAVELRTCSSTASM